jgi:hypothetical protein
LVVSKEVYGRCPPALSEKFAVLPFPFEGQEVALYSKRNKRDASLEWIGRVPIAESVRVNMLPRRYSETDKARIVQFATSEVIDLGTALSTCSQYLVSTARPAPYRDVVRSLAERGSKSMCEKSRYPALNRWTMRLIMARRIMLSLLCGFVS